MLRQDMFFAERNTSENYCINRLQKATEMNSYSSKRKRMDDQYLAPEATSSIYGRPGMGFLTTPFTSVSHKETEHTRKRFHPCSEQAVLIQNNRTTHTVDRVALNTANQVLGNEQVQQFTNSTVLARHRTVTKPGSDSNVGYWSHDQPKSRPTQQNFHAFSTHQIISMGRTATQSNVAPQIQGHTSVQKVAPQDNNVSRNQTQQYVETTVFYGQNQSCVQNKGFYGQYQPSVQTGSYCGQSQIVDLEKVHYYRSNRIQNGQSKQYATIAPDQICPQNRKNTDKRRKKRKSKTSEVQQGSRTAPNVDKVNNSNNQQSSFGLTNTHHLTTSGHSQNSLTNKPEPWSLVPQAVLMHVKPMEAQTNQTISKLLALREAEKNGYHQVVAKRKRDTTQSENSGRKRKKIKGQSQSHDSEQLSTEQAGGKQKTVKRIVVPPNIRQNPVSYPPYVSRIMKILARGQQNQTEISDDNQCTNEDPETESVSKQKAEVQLKPRVSEKYCHGITEKCELITESVSKEIKQKVTTPRNVDIKKFFETCHVTLFLTLTVSMDRKCLSLPVTSALMATPPSCDLTVVSVSRQR